MSWNGAGTFNRIFSWVADAAAAINITASRMDTDSNDIVSNGFGNCLTRDGQGSATANLPMGAFRHTGVGNAVNRTDYASAGQVQDGIGLNWTVAGGVADALTATYTPAITVLVDGQLCFVRAVNANATTTPTFSPNGLTARTITKAGGAALLAGDIPGNLAEIVLRYNLANTRWELINQPYNFNPQVSNTNWVAAGGSADAITATYSPAITALVDGMLCWFRATAANATTTPTFAPNGLTARTITRSGGGALLAKDIPAALAEVILRYNLANTRWELLNPLGKPAAPTRQVLTSGTAATYTTPAGATQLRIRMIGGGASGGGSKGSNGNVGNTSTFNSIVAAGGSAGGGSNSGAGGAFGQGGTGGTGAASLRIPGGTGASGQSAVSVGTGGIGGSGAFGGAGGATVSGSNGSPAAANSGAGGGGAGAFDGADAAGGGGGAGEYLEMIINAPAATYVYTVAATAAAGATTGAAGGTGGSGLIIVDETYF